MFRQGEPVSELVVLLRGRVTTRVQALHGRVITVGVWAAPSALDKVALLSGGRHTCTAYAAVACSWRSMPAALFECLVDDVPALRRHVLRILAQRAHTAQQAFIDAASLPVTARLAKWLLREAADTGEVALRQSQDELAQLLGATRVSVNRALRNLEDDRLICRSSGRIVVRAPEALLARAGGQVSHE